jgi:hypothetical protein
MTPFGRRFLPIALATGLVLAPAARAAGAQPPPQVYLSHLYVVLDPASYDSILASPAIHSLAETRQEHVDASNGSWTGIYITAKHTYIELFSSKQPPPESGEGRTGVGLQVETSGGVQAVADRFRPSFGSRAKLDEEKFKQEDGRMVRAFSIVEVEAGETPSALELWVMENDPAFLRAKHPEARIDDPLTRLRYNAWHYEPKLALEDIVGVRAALVPAEMAELEIQLRASGWAIERRGDGFVARGPDITFDIVPAGKRAGIRELSLRMSHAVSRQSVSLGLARLQLDGMEGHLTFWADE